MATNDWNVAFNDSIIIKYLCTTEVKLHYGDAILKAEKSLCSSSDAMRDKRQFYDGFAPLSCTETHESRSFTGLL